MRFGLAVAIVAAFTGHALAPPALVSMKPSIAVKLSAPTDVFVSGQPLSLKASVANVSSAAVFVRQTPGLASELDYKILALDQDGKEPPLTMWGRMYRGKRLPDDPIPRSVTNSQMLLLKPGESSEAVLQVNQIYEIQPGTYTVWVQRGDEAVHRAVDSNKVVLIVIPGAKS